MNFYKNVIEHRGKLLVRGIHEGKEYKEKIDYSPTLYAITQEVNLLEYEKKYKEGISRLACQIELKPEHDGLIVHLLNDELL